MRGMSRRQASPQPVPEGGAPPHRQANGTGSRQTLWTRDTDNTEREHLLPHPRRRIQPVHVDGSAPHQGLRSSCHQAHPGSRRAPPRFGGVLAVGGELHPCTSSGGLDRLCGGISHHDKRRAGSDGRAHSSTLTCASLHAGVRRRHIDTALCKKCPTLRQRFWERLRVLGN
jgi:hypothetical protein